MRVALFVVAALSLLTSCRASKSGPTPPASARSLDSAEPGVIPGFSVPPLAPRLTWSPLRDTSAVGVPAGCTVRGTVRRAPLPKGTVRFVAPSDSASELLVAIDEDGDGQVDRDAILDPEGVPSRALPWKGTDAAPIVARSSTGYLALGIEETGSDRKRAVLWREPGRLEIVAEGDRLEAVDATCDGTTCALLLTHASASAGPGATVFVGEATQPVSTWTRADLSGDTEGTVPFSISGVGNGSAAVTLNAGGVFSMFRIEKGKQTPLGRITAPFGAYDVVLGDAPLAVAPGESIDEPCKMDGFAVRLVTSTGTSAEVDGQVPPTQVITRRLDSGFIVAWLAPVSCRHDGQNIVRAFLLGKNGVPASSTMAVADADGFAVSTHGDDLDMWLSRRGELVWVQATCRFAPALPAPSTAPPR